MKKPLVVANWKLNKTTNETRAFIEELKSLIKDVEESVEVVIAPPFTSLFTAHLATKGSNLKLSAQNVFYEDKGAFTGEISPSMLVDVGCSYVIVGHSERRQYFFETDEIINKKIKSSLKHPLNVIFCIGESLKEREEGKTFEILQRQLADGLKEVTPKGLVIAYEPVWAIGTGKTATPEQAEEAHMFIREWLLSKYGVEDGNGIRVIYGGSVTPENIDSLMACHSIEGVLVGGASLKVESFAEIVNFKGRKN